MSCLAHTQPLTQSRGRSNIVPLLGKAQRIESLDYEIYENAVYKVPCRLPLARGKGPPSLCCRPSKHRAHRASA